MSHIENIKSFLLCQPKNKLVISSAPVEGLQYINAGRLLSAYLVDKLDRSDVAQMAQQYLLQFLRDNKSNHPVLGEYLALENLCILQEPELKTDEQYLLKEISKACLLIVNPTDSTVDFNSIPHLSL